MLQRGVRLVGEDVVGDRGLDDPRALLHLAVELARPPACVADIDARSPQRAERVRIDLGREEADLLDDQALPSGGSSKSASTTTADD